MGIGHGLSDPAPLGQQWRSKLGKDPDPRVLEEREVLSARWFIEAASMLPIAVLRAAAENATQIHIPSPVLPWDVHGDWEGYPTKANLTGGAAQLYDYCKEQSLDLNLVADGASIVEWIRLPSRGATGRLRRRRRGELPMKLAGRRL